MRWNRLVVIGATGAAVAVGAAFALAAPGNPHRGDPHRGGTTGEEAAVDHYLHARAAMVREAEANLAIGRTAMDALTERVQSECPGVLVGAPPETPEKGKLGNQWLLISEIQRALEVVQREGREASVRRFVAGIRRLQWRDHRLAGLVETLGRIETARLGARPPNVCRDLKSWVARGYRVLPADVAGDESAPEEETFRNQLDALGCLSAQLDPPERAVLAVLRRHEARAGRSTAREVELGEWRLQLAEDRLQGPRYLSLVQATGVPSDFLGRQPLPPRVPTGAGRKPPTARECAS